VYVGVSPSFVSLHMLIGVARIIIVYLLYFIPSDFLQTACAQIFFFSFTPLSFHGSLSGGDNLMGRNHRFSYPPYLYFFLSPYPYGTLLTSVNTKLYVHWSFPHVYNVKELNIFCSVLSFCTFIITDNFHLSRGF